MKIVFFGTSEFGINCLKTLVKSDFEVVQVVTSADRKSGRGLKIHVSPIKEFALENKIPLFQPENINEAQSVKFLKQLKADLYIVIAYGQILSKELLRIPTKSAINVHASLLPKYRGAAPINWAIANGETETGISIIKMNGFMDRGDIILQKIITIEDCDDAVFLSHKLSDLSAVGLIEALNLLTTSKANFIKQDDQLASLAPCLRKENGLINWDTPAQEILNRIRAFVPWPGSYTFLNEKLIKIFKAKVMPINVSDAKPGTIINIDKHGFTVAAAKDGLLIQELQIEAKRRMAAEEFISGHHIQAGSKFVSY